VGSQFLEQDAHEGGFCWQILRRRRPPPQRFRRPRL